eukprot:CAMPEP_0172540686 /NCGR_PEP_ID=MMETSP1067-20121228/11643_1 /TAXON_ID=265564 ORGANISM="Thalassiosira punctigera, Strain Tpunct2005C2" /NCGR_SAMPLE_ID=MMETSP1067 /ASSEMBLY_ACC=CAM_ASM_000444 /LENGTH=115 /DNA_ID=CAMNT_0013326589 /DNA_START=97 /DNA_END=441 /DNA_ORIENTATION=-
MTSNTDKEKGESHDSNNNIKNEPIATSSKDETAAKKKKKPMQHLLAGGTAGLVESSVCHPLDTIKTRMQLRRHNTLKGRALGSLREVAGRKDRALHRTAAGGSGSSTREPTAKIT